MRLIKLNEYKRRQAPVGIASPIGPSGAIGAIRSPPSSVLKSCQSSPLRSAMKQITAIIKPFKLDEVREALPRSA